MRAAVAVLLVLAAGCGTGGDDPGAVATSSPSPAPSTSGPASVAPDPTDSSTTAPAATAPVATASAATTATATTAATTTATTTTTDAAPASSAPEPPVRPSIDELRARPDVLNIAHAGGDQEWPHSTFHAFDGAVAAGADVLEMDVQLSADGVVVVVHDETVDGTTGSSGRVDAMTFDELASLDAAHWYVPGCWPCRDLADDAYVLRGVRTGERPAPEGLDPDALRIVSLAEMAERYPAMPFDIEIKGTGDGALATAEVLAADIERLGLTDHAVVVSFDDATIDRFHELAPAVAVSPGVGALTRWLLDGEPLPERFEIVQVPPEFAGTPVITPEFWAAADAAGVDVWVWPSDATTQENAEFYRDMIAQGASGIIAGRPSDMPVD